MLSAEERRRLDEIERLLQYDDPRFVARMRSEPAARRRWPLPVFYAVVWVSILVVWAAAGWRAGLVAAVVGGLTALVVEVSRRRRQRETWPPRPDWVPDGW